METHTAGSASGLRKRRDGNIGTAPQADRTARARIVPGPCYRRQPPRSSPPTFGTLILGTFKFRDDIRVVV